MNDRTKSLWLPGLGVFAASMIWMAVLQRFNSSGRAPWAHSGMPVPIYLLWLLPQPIFGAAGAYLSRRAGALPKTRLVASLFPSLVVLAMVSCVIVFGIVVQRDPHIVRQPLNILLTFLTWAVLPGIALLCGALPFCKVPKPASC
jgi:hypothetical protein